MSLGGLEGGFAIGADVREAEAAARFLEEHMDSSLAVGLETPPVERLQADLAHVRAAGELHALAPGRVQVPVELPELEDVGEYSFVRLVKDVNEAVGGDLLRARVDRVVPEGGEDVAAGGEREPSPVGLEPERPVGQQTDGRWCFASISLTPVTIWGRIRGWPRTIAGDSGRLPAMDDRRRVAFLKTLIAAAWADGELGNQEIRTLSYYLQRFQITDAEYQELQPLLETPVRLEQARAVLDEQLALLATPEERRTLMAAVEDLLVVDDHLKPEETAFLQNLRELTRHVPTAQLFISRLKALWSSTPSPRGTTLSRTVDRFLQKRLLEYFRSRIAVARARAGLSVRDEVSDSDLYRVVIWAGLLNHVAIADRSLCPAEQDQLLDLLSVSGEVPRPDLEVIASAFSDGSLDGIDLPVLVRELTQTGTAEDNAVLLDGLFLVAAADGAIHDRELRVIRQIAESAGFSESSFLAAHERCKRRMAAGWN
jgi:uncharacterized tellurite resistance protein B-like protein